MMSLTKLYVSPLPGSDHWASIHTCTHTHTHIHTQVSNWWIITLTELRSCDHRSVSIIRTAVHVWPLNTRSYNHYSLIQKILIHHRRDVQQRIPHPEQSILTANTHTDRRKSSHSHALIKHCIFSGVWQPQTSFTLTACIRTAWTFC